MGCKQRRGPPKEFGMVIEGFRSNSFSYFSIPGKTNATVASGGYP